MSYEKNWPHDAFQIHNKSETLEDYLWRQYSFIDDTYDPDNGLIDYNGFIELMNECREIYVKRWINPLRKTIDELNKQIKILKLKEKKVDNQLVNKYNDLLDKYENLQKENQKNRIIKATSKNILPKINVTAEENRNIVKLAMVEFIQKNKKQPTLTELIIATGLSYSTVQKHRETIITELNKNLTITNSDNQIIWH